MMLLNHLIGIRIFGMSDIAGTLVTLPLEQAKVFVEHAIITSIFSRIRMRYWQMFDHINFYSTRLLVYYVELTLLQIVIIAVQKCRLLHNRCLSNRLTLGRNFDSFA